jgi:Tol biopolymer transport system component
VPPPPLTGFDINSIKAGLHQTEVRFLAGAAGVAVLQANSDPAPSFGATYQNKTFNTNITRVTQGAWGIHTYSQLQAFSYDNKYVLLAEGASEDGMDSIIRGVPGYQVVLSTSQLPIWNAPRWHPTQPEKVIHFDSNEDTTVRVQLTQVPSATTQTVFTFPSQYIRVLGNQSSDEVSRDGKWIAGMVINANEEGTIFTLNLSTQQLGAVISISSLYGSGGPCAPDPQWGAVEPDWVGVSPLGKYLVVQWVRDGAERCSGLETFEISTGNFVGRLIQSHPHGDMTLLADGKTEVFVSVDLTGPSSGTYVGGAPGGTQDDANYPALSYRVLPGPASGSAAPNYLYLTDWVYEHMSCRGPYGWCLVSARLNPDNGAYDPLENEIFLIKLDGSKLVRLTHHHSAGPSYWNQPRPSFSADGRYVIFDSDWAGSGSNASYVIDLATAPNP